MKDVRFCLFVLTAFLFNSCQNELSGEFPTDAQGSLHDPLGDCYPSTVQGIYKEDSLLTPSNYIDAAVFITTVGDYDIKSDTLNGYYFRGTGTVNNAGLNTVRLTAQGQPDTAGLNIFHISFDTSVCEIPVQVIDATVPPAEFTLGGSGGTCTGAVLAGTYTSGTAMTAANTVTLNVTVTTGGPYSINVPQVNGVSFSGSGILTTSTTSIILTAQGIPSASTTAVAYDYAVTAGTGSCTFTVTYAGVPLGPASFTFNCGTMDPVFPLAGGVRLRVGEVLDPMIDTITTEVNVITPGTYNIVTTYGLGGADGVTFNTSGVFTTTGVQTLRLGASGTAGRGGIVFYNISSPQSTNPTPCSTSCYYEFLYGSIDGSSYQNFTFLSNTVNDNSSLPGYDLVRWQGYRSVSGAENIELTIGLPTGGDFNTMSADVIYSSNDFPATYVKAVYTDNSSTVYSAETDGTTQSSPFTITIVFCTAGRIEGNYTGTVKDNGGAGPGTKIISGNFGLWRL